MQVSGQFSLMLASEVEDRPEREMAGGVGLLILADTLWTNLMLRPGFRAIVHLVPVIVKEADPEGRRLAADGEKGEHEEDQSGEVHGMNLEPPEKGGAEHSVTWIESARSINLRCF